MLPFYHLIGCYAAFSLCGIAIDYSSYSRDASPETLAAVGWSDNLKMLSYDWFFMDDRLNTDAFRIVTEQVERDTRLSVGERLQSAFRLCLNFFDGSERFRRGLNFALLGTVLMAAAGVLMVRREERLRTALGATAVLFGGAVLFLYLGWTGRMIVHGVATIYLPIGICLYATIFTFGEKSTDGQTINDLLDNRGVMALAATAMVAAWIILSCFSTTYSLLEAKRRDHALYGEHIPEIDIDIYALEHPEYLFVHDYSMPSNEFVFPDSHNGIPTNVVSWGGWAIHTPGWWKTMNHFGITKLTPDIFLKENVVFATRDCVPPSLFLNYLQENTQGEVQWERFDTFGVIYFYQFSTDIE